MALLDEIRRFWDEDAAVYDSVPNHAPVHPMTVAAWTAALADALPPPPARVLDCGAGTGFLSLAAARLGHHVTALDLSEAMLGRLRAKAEAAHLDVEVVAGSASEPPDGPFDVVVERHLLWTMPDPGAALAAWRRSAPAGRLALFESLWGSVDPVEGARARLRHLLARVRGEGSGHHAEYEPHLRAALPLGTGTAPDRLVELALGAGWPAPRLRRLADVEWAERCELPLPERLLGVQPRFVLLAG